jgi:cytochrome P450
MFIPFYQTDGMQHGLVFNNDYQSWKRKRRFVAQSLMSPRFLRQFTHLTQSLFNENESFWDKKEHHIDFAKWVKFFTTDITSQTVTRKPSYCLSAYLFGEEHISDPIKSKEIKESVRFFDALQTLMNNFAFQLFVPETLKNYFPGFYNLNQKYKKNTDWIYENIFDIIKKRRLELESDETTDSNLIDVLLTLNTSHDHGEYVEGEETPMTDEEIRTTLMEVSSAGTDSTGNAFCFIVWQLAHHPKVVARFHEEIKEILGDDVSRPISYEDLEKFTYLDAIIKESSRVIPLAPMSPRTSTQESVIGGKRWDANTIFFIHHEQIQKSSDCWKDSDQFIPERFLKESDNKIVKNSFIPFGGGIRICPGRNMVIVELKTLLILLYRKYDAELVDKISKKPKIRYAAFNICTEMNVILRPRKGINI